MSRLKELYKNEIMDAMTKKFGYKNVMEVPKLDKIVINMGVGEAKENAKLLDAAIADMELITGQKAIATKAKKSVANFKIREGMPIGCTLAYLHVPFCETRCLYCMFYQNPYSKEASSVFARNLVREIELWSDKAAMNSHPVHAVYFGGGTPTALEPEDLKTVLTAVNRYLPLANDCEITIEGRIHNFGDDKIEDIGRASCRERV